MSKKFETIYINNRVRIKLTIVNGMPVIHICLGGAASAEQQLKGGRGSRGNARHVTIILCVVLSWSGRIEKKTELFK
jgi:hypothetical protein